MTTPKRTLVVFNDLHIGVIRSGGATPVTALALRNYVLEGAKALLDIVEDNEDVLINGDLFDTRDVPYTDLWETLEIFWAFLRSHPNSKVYAAGGNHDYSKDSTRMSSFQLFCRVMESSFSSQFQAIHEPTALPLHDAYVIPHVQNQDLFNLALEKVPSCGVLYLHCNYNNHFATESDHSLNLSPEQATAAPVDHIVLGHEHQRSTALAGKVVVPGNQIPTSVADCLGNTEKYFLVAAAGKVELYPCWVRADEYIEVDWQDASALLADTKYRFIRVAGTAVAAQAAAVPSAVSKLRSSNRHAFVITSSVKIAGSEGAEALSLEEIKSYNVLEQLLKRLTKAQAAKVTALLAKHNNTEGAA